MKLLSISYTTAALVMIAGCATQPEPLQDADQPYLGGKYAPEASPRPQPRPSWIKCPREPNFHWWKKYPVGEDPASYCKHSEDETPGTPTPEIECTLLWKPGAMLAIREKECASLAFLKQMESLA